jgi:hypothetical protein
MPKRALKHDIKSWHQRAPEPSPKESRLICQAAVSSTLMFISDGPQSTVAFDMPNHSKTILLSAGKRHGNGRKGNVAGRA